MSYFQVEQEKYQEKEEIIQAIEPDSMVDEVKKP
jgi:hypothetical protein